MIDVIRGLLGTYTPITDGTGVIPSGLAGVNIEYVVCAVLFGICLVCVFKLLGVVLKAICRF